MMKNVKDKHIFKKKNEEDHIIMIEITDENNNCMKKIKKINVVKKDYHFL